MIERSFFPSMRAGVLAGLAVATLLASSMVAAAQVTACSQTTTAPNGQQQERVTLSASPKKKKDDKVVQSKDTKRELRKEKKLVPQTAEDAKLPDKQLYDKALL